MAKAEKMVKVRVLLDCAFGKANDVVEVTEAEAKDHAHELDASTEAVTYAEGLKKDSEA